MKQPKPLCSNLAKTISTNNENRWEDNIPPCVTPDDKNICSEVTLPHLTEVQFLLNQFSSTFITLIYR